MNNIKQSLGLALRNLPRRGQHNVVKILCLALGLSISAVIIAEIYYEQTYDQCYPDYDRICRVTEGFKMKAQDFTESFSTSGGVAPLMKKTIPEVELATRTNPIATDGEIEDNEKVKVKADVYFADSCFFRMFPTKILQGDASKALTDPFCCVVSRTTAERLGGNVIGRRIHSTMMPTIELTVMAVYEDYPHNSTFHRYDVIGSLNTQRHFSFDGQDWLVGNDRYRSFVKIRKGVDPASFGPKIQNMIKIHYPAKELQQAGVSLTYKITPISQYYTDGEQIRQMFWILSLLAFVLLAASVLNYVLIVVGNMVTRAREMAVRKCYGAGRSIIYVISFAEAAVHLLIAVALGALLLFVCQGTIEQLLSAPLRVLLFNRGSWILAFICVLVLIVGGIIPAWLYNRMPVAVAFQGYVESRRRWKVVLLGVEFAMVSFLLALLLIVSLQYRHNVDFDLGYQCDDIAVTDVTALTSQERQQAADEVRRVSGVRAVSACNSIPFYGGSGNNITVPGENQQLFNVSDLYTVGDHYFDMLRIPVVSGKTFAAHSDSLAQVMVSQSFAAMMKRLRGWDDVVGRKVLISEHSIDNNSPFTIIGVFKDIHIGTAESNGFDRPVVIFYGSQSHGRNNMMLIQFDELTVDGMAAVQTRLQRFFPGKTIVLQSMESEKNMQYVSTLNFRNGVMTAGIVVLFIALLGLVGYVTDEVNRRHREIAIRKVNGARAADIVLLFLRGIMKTALPASVVGAVGAWVVAAQWLMLYDNRISLRVWWFVAVVLVVLLIVVGVTVLNSRRVANSNPIGFLKQE